MRVDRAGEAGGEEPACPAGDEGLCPSKSVEDEGGRHSVPCGRERTLGWEAPE